LVCGIFWNLFLIKLAVGKSLVYYYQRKAGLNGFGRRICGRAGVWASWLLGCWPVSNPPAEDVRGPACQ